MKKTRIVVLLLMILLVGSLTGCGLFGTPTTESPITIIYDTDGGAPTIPKVVIKPSEVVVSQLTDKEVTKEGYEIDYWYLIDNGQIEKNLTDYFKRSSLPASVILKIKWKRKVLQLTIDHNVNDDDFSLITVKKDGQNVPVGAFPFKLEVEYGQSIELTSILNYTVDGIYGLAFVGWGTNVDWHIDEYWSDSGSQNIENNRILSIESVKENAVYEAIWESSIEYLVTVYENITSNEEGVTLPFGAGLSHKLLPSKEKEGSVFSGWSTEKDNEATLLIEKNEKIIDLLNNGDEIFALWLSRVVVSYALETDGSGDYITVTGLNPKIDDKTIYIPDYIPNRSQYTPVKKIGPEAFSDLSAEYKIIVPYSITYIERDAFDDYKGNIYFDVATDLDLVSSANFDANHKIYLHASHVDSVDSSSYANKFKTSSKFNADLVNGVFVNYFGEILDDYVNNDEKLKLWYRYTYEFTMPNPVSLNCSGHRNSDNINKLAQPLNELVMMANDTAGSDGSFNLKAGKFVLPARAKKTSKLVGSEATSGDKRQDKAIPLLYNELDNENKRTLPIEYAPLMPVYNSEQAFYALAKGMQPVFIEGTNYSASAKEAYVNVLETVKKITDEDMDHFELVTRIHDWIVVNNTYDSELLDLFETKPQSEIGHYRGFYLEGVMIDGKGVCDSISKAFLAMCKVLEIECIKVEGLSLGGGGGTGVAHAWNKVKIDGLWYVVDVTGDSPIVSDKDGTINNGKSFEILKHDYFMVPNDDSDLKNKNVENSNENYPVAFGRYDYPEETLYNNVRSIEVKSKQELEDYCNYVKGLPNIEVGRLYTIEIYVTGGYSIAGVGDVLGSKFGGDYKGTIGDSNVHKVALLKGWS